MLLGCALACTLPSPVTNDQLDEIWKEELFSGLAPLQRFPRREINATAKQLEEIGTFLGIDSTSPHRPELAAPAPEDAARYEGGRAPNAWVEAAFAAGHSSLPNLPDETEAYLTWAAHGLQRAEELLLGSEPPSWGLDISLMAEMPVPNFMVQMQLHKLLSLRALRFQREGAFDAVDRTLEAAWRLRQATGSDPVLLGHLAAMAEARYEMLVLRRLCSPDDRWQVRLGETEFQSKVLQAFQAEAWATSGAMRRDLADANVLFRFAAPGYGEAVQHAVERLRNQDPRTFDNTSFFEEEQGRIPRWNVPARVVFPNLFDSWAKAVRVELEAELTRAILLQRSGVGPQAPARISSSRVAGASWRVERVEEQLFLRFEDQIPEPYGRNLSLDYSISPAACTPPRQTES